MIRKRRSLTQSRRPRGPYVLNPESRHAKDLILWVPCYPGGLNSTVYDFSLYKEHGIGALWNASQEMYTNGLTPNVAAANHVDFMGLNFYASPSGIVNWSTPSVRLRDLPTTYDFTIASWILPDIAGPSSAIWSWSGTDDIIYYPNDIAGDDGPRLFWRDLGGNIIDVAAGLITGETHWDVLTSRGSADHELYRDGLSLGASTDTGTAGPFSTFHYGGFGSQTFEGWLSDLRVYSRGMSSEEIFDMWEDPWDLYHELGTRSYFFYESVVAAPAAGPTLRHPIEYHRHNLTR